jgi:acyl carrier protein
MKIMESENGNKYVNCFLSVFELESTEKLNLLTYQSIKEWDSVGHMNLISILEEEFDIMLDTDDIIDLSSFEKGKSILSKYGVHF